MFVHGKLFNRSLYTLQPIAKIRKLRTEKVLLTLGPAIVCYLQKIFITFATVYQA
jgi:hypothetical protein